MKLLEFEQGYWKVEFEGKIFKVFMARIQTGFEYEYMGRWFPEGDPIFARLLSPLGLLLKRFSRSLKAWKHRC